MKVMKFGGTSVGTPQRMKEVTQLVVKSGEPVFVVLSAMSGTTNSLVEISDYLYKKNADGANEVINRLENKYMKHVDELYEKDETKQVTREFLKDEFNYLRSFTKEIFTSFEEKAIVAQGEMMSTNMVVNYMKELGIKAVLLNALDFMRTDKNAEPDPVYIKEKLQAIIAENEGQQVYITQGFICRNAYGEIDNLQRGGSDYTASLIGAALNAEEIQIWTDIDGMHNNDPRVVDKTQTRDFLRDEFNYLRSFTKELFTSFEEKNIVAQGEMMSTNMVANYMKEQGINAVLLNALDFMRTDKNSEPDPVYIKEKLNAILADNEGAQVYITQGFICRNAYGEVDNLQRGGSDYTASLVGAAIGAEEIQIWTDIDGMHNNDPRVVDHTEPVHQLHFEEAAELAYFGAKILHPTCVQPAKYAGIPVRLLNTMDPDAEGTTISNATEYGKIKAIAAKDNIIAIKIKSSRMLLATGFLRKVFEIFESYQTPIDMVCTSEVGVSMSIDNSAHLGEIVDELKKYGTVTVDTGMCIICVVGDLDWSNIGFETLALDALKDIPVRMVSYGGSNYNISFLIREEDKKRALQKLSDTIFNK